ncbi:MAG: SAM-dependent methyltransferase [Planctomycetes bacterium]|nr:SAM-dependent methyltransferase [Planctomycetota bacterium]
MAETLVSGTHAESSVFTLLEHRDRLGVIPMINAWNLISEALEDQTCLLLVLSKVRRGVTADLKKVTVRPVAVGGRRKYQLTRQLGTQQTFENLEPETAAERVISLLRTTFEHCHLFTVDADYTIRIQRDGSIKIKRKPPSRQPESLDHDRAKNYLIPDGLPCPFLVEIGVMTSDGRVGASKYNKFRQINRFLELVDDIVPYLPGGGTVHVVDVGCGKSYLTFALHHLLTVIHRRRVRIVGLDRNESVIRDVRRVAERLECEGLDFLSGDIADYQPTGPVHLVVSLHACDTATDDAIAKAVRWQVPVILAVPCCQHELAPRIHAEPLEPIHRHGLLHERFAALATDALRAAVLDLCGYKTQVTEFIDIEHTAKNVLIRAVRRAGQPTKGETTTPDAAPPDGDPAERLSKFKQWLGLKTTYLERALGDAFPCKQFTCYSAPRRD